MEALRTTRGTRITIRVPIPARTNKKIAKAAAEYDRLGGEEAGTRAELAALDEQLQAADAKHVRAYADALAANRPEPPETERAKLEALKASQERRAAALPLALDEAEAALVAAIEGERETLLADTLARQAQARERARAAVTELATARADLMTERAISGWLSRFPQFAGRAPSAATPPVRELLGQNGDPIGFDVVLAALSADLESPKAASA